MRRAWLVLLIVLVGCVGSRDSSHPASTSDSQWGTARESALPAFFVPPPLTVKHGQRRPPPVVTPQGDVFYRLALCETGGTMDRYAISPSGRYFSYFQWSLTTWRSAGGTGHPFDHTYEEQKAIAEAWQIKAGWKQWPACSRRLHLR